MFNYNTSRVPGTASGPEQNPWYYNNDHFFDLFSIVKKIRSDGMWLNAEQCNRMERTEFWRSDTDKIITQFNTNSSCELVQTI